MSFWLEVVGIVLEYTLNKMFSFLYDPFKYLSNDYDSLSNDYFPDGTKLPDVCLPCVRYDFKDDLQNCLCKN